MLLPLLSVVYLGLSEIRFLPDVVLNLVLDPGRMKIWLDSV
jgi:hypothetical protein